MLVIIMTIEILSGIRKNFFIVCSGPRVKKPVEDAVSDLIPCPTCQSLLRIPAGAAMIRCPSCKTVLAVEATAAPAVPAAPVTAPPLPFDRPKQTSRANRGGTASPPPVAPVAKAVAMPGAGAPMAIPVQPRLAAVNLKELTSGTDATPEQAEKRKRLRRELRKMEERERRLAERYKELERHCSKGRVSVTMLMWAMRAQALAVVLLLVGVLGATLVDPSYATMIALAANSFGGLAMLMILAGFGMAVVGPEKGRHIGVMGLIVTLITAILVVFDFQAGWTIVAQLQEPPEHWSETLAYYKVFAAASELPALSEAPARVLQGYPFSLLSIIAAALEFSRLVMICLLIQIYATQGNDVEAGHRSVATVSTVFWFILLCALFRIAAGFGFDWAQPEDLWYQVGRGAHGLIAMAAILGVGLGLFWASQVMDEVQEVVDHRRFVENDEKSAI